MAEIDSHNDQDNILISKISDRMRKTAKNKKGFTGLRSLSCTPKSTPKVYAKLESKEDYPLSHNLKPCQAKTRARTLSGKSNPSLLVKSPQRTMFRKASSFGAVDFKTSAIVNSPTKEKWNNPNSPLKQTIKVFDFQNGRPIRRSPGCIRRKKSSLRIVWEKRRSKSYDAVKPSMMRTIDDMKRENLMPIRRNFSPKLPASPGFEPFGSLRSKSYSPSYEMNPRGSIETLTLGRSAIENTGAKTDVPKLLVIKRNTFNMLKKVPGLNLLSVEKNTVAPKPGKPK